MRRVDCIGMVGKLPTPKGKKMFWDTGRSVTPVQLAELLALRHSYFSSTAEEIKEITSKIYSLMRELAEGINVYPIGFAGIADDGRVLVTEPWFEEKDT